MVDLPAHLLVRLVHKEVTRTRLVEPSAEAVRLEHLELELEQSHRTSARSVQKELHRGMQGGLLVLLAVLDLTKKKLGKLIAKVVQLVRLRLELERRTARLADKFLSQESVFFHDRGFILIHFEASLFVKRFFKKWTNGQEMSIFLYLLLFVVLGIFACERHYSFSEVRGCFSR